MITLGGQNDMWACHNCVFNRNKTVLYFSFQSIMSSVLDSAMSVGSIIGTVLGIIVGIIMLLCCIVFICQWCKNKNRRNVWAEPPPPYYSDRSYGQNVNAPYYQQQAMTTYNEKY